MPQAPVNGVNIHYQDGGQGPPALFLPGLASDHNIWAPVVSRLRQRLRCIAMDSRGTGKSGCPDGPWSIADLAQDALALLQHLGLERAHVVGFSMGGMVAQEMALDAPQAVCSLRGCFQTGSRGSPEGVSPSGKGFGGRAPNLKPVPLSLTEGRGGHRG